MSYHRCLVTSICRYQTSILKSTAQQQLLWKQQSSYITRVTSPHQQCRYIFSYLTDLFRSNNVDKSDNPILTFVKQQPLRLPVVDQPIINEGDVATEAKISAAAATTAATVQQPENAIDLKTFPNFTTMKPSHVLDALEYVQQEQLRLLQQAVDDVQNTVVTHHHSSLLQQLDTIIRWIDTIQQPFYTLRQITSFMCTIVVSPSSSKVNQQPKEIKSEWYEAVQSLQEAPQNHTAHITFPIVHKSTTSSTTDTELSFITALQWQKLHVELYKMTQAIEQLQSSSSPMVLTEHDRSNLFASHYLIKNYINETGDDPKQLFLDDNNTENTSPVDKLHNENMRQRYTELSEILIDIKSNILDIESTSVSLSSVKWVYSYLGIRTEQVKMLGYNTIADQIFGNTISTRTAQYDVNFEPTVTTDIETVRQLHLDMSQRLLPILRQITDKSRRATQPKLALESYLSSSKNGSGLDATALKHRQLDAPTSQYSIQQYKSDIRSMIRLEYHVTLAGALQFSFRLIQDIFNISIVESAVDSDIPYGNATKWDSSVRLFHCYDILNCNKYIGSIYVDPFQRKEKMPRPVTIPIVARCENQEPIVCISLALEVPIWDTNPAKMTWDDCEALLHELGHALQFVMAQSKYGCVLGPQTMPLDKSELLPKFMELWMTQRSSIYALIDMSESITPLSDEEIDAAYRVKAREKVLKLAELTFYGTLELELFSNFDIKGSETILALQERLAAKMIPHIDYDKNDMTALLDIIEDNVHGRQVAWYRYVLCEVQAATMLEHMMYVMSTKAEDVAQLGKYMRQYLLEPGADIQYSMFRSKLSFGTESIDPMWKLHMLSDNNETTA